MIFETYILVASAKTNETKWASNPFLSFNKPQTLVQLNFPLRCSVEISQQENPLYPVYSSQTSNDGIMGYLDDFMCRRVNLEAVYSAILHS